MLSLVEAGGCEEKRDQAWPHPFDEAQDAGLCFVLIKSEQLLRTVLDDTGLPCPHNGRRA
jgi:hypothetical protein